MRRRTAVSAVVAGSPFLVVSVAALPPASVGSAAGGQQVDPAAGEQQRTTAANGVLDDLSTARYAADHADPATAVAAAEAEFGRRQDVESHDALGRALHSAGRDGEALAHAATWLGGRSALFLYHRGVIEAAVGRRGQARVALAAALDADPHFSPLQSPGAQELLDSLGGRP